MRVKSRLTLSLFLSHMGRKNYFSINKELKLLQKSQVVAKEKTHIVNTIT